MNLPSRGCLSTLSRKRRLATLAKAAAIVSVNICGLAQAANFYFDADGDASGATAGTGAGDLVTPIWRQGTAAGTLGTWTNGNTNEAVLGGTAGIVSLTDTI